MAKRKMKKAKQPKKVEQPEKVVRTPLGKSKKLGSRKRGY